VALQLVENARRNNQHNQVRTAKQLNILRTYLKKSNLPWKTLCTSSDVNKANKQRKESSKEQGGQACSG